MGFAFALGWTPCIGSDPGHHSRGRRQPGYGRQRRQRCSPCTGLGLGLPFILAARPRSALSSAPRGVLRAQFGRIEEKPSGVPARRRLASRF